MANEIPKHVAIIMDGNGRWAQQQNRPRIFGHKKGIEKIDEIVRTSIQNKIKFLSLFAFSTENWNRPTKEINFIMKLAINKLTNKTLKAFNEQEIQFRWTGFAKSLPKQLIDKLKLMEKKTSHNKKIILNICLNYGGKQDILQAVEQTKKTNKSFEELLLTKDLPSIDLLIRTGNEKRISNFMLWQIAYAEIVFEPTFWPSYNSEIFTKNLLEFSNRKRRFGKI